MPGPVPKRSDERRRRNTPAAGPVEKVDISALPVDDPNSLAFLIKQPIVVPETPTRVDEETGEVSQSWHPIALELWDSFMRSGQAMYWEPSDWMVAKLLCESLSRDLQPQVVGISPASEFGPAEVVKERIPLKGASLGAYLKGFAALMLTEGDRRRLSIELERERLKDEAGATPGKVLKITDRKRALMAARPKEASGG